MHARVLRVDDICVMCVCVSQRELQQEPRFVAVRIYPRAIRTDGGGGGPYFKPEPNALGTNFVHINGHLEGNVLSNSCARTSSSTFSWPCVGPALGWTMHFPLSAISQHTSLKRRKRREKDFRNIRQSFCLSSASAVPLYTHNADTAPIHRLPISPLSTV